jgi:large subunit ribosomal protein L10
VDRAEKKQLVSDLHQTFQDVSTVVVARPHGLSVAEANDLRRQMVEQGARYKVAKNTLARIALDGTKFQGLLPMMQGQTALAWSEDPVAAAKVAVDYANKNKKLEILGGAYGETVLDPQGVQSLAKTPDLEESRAKIVGLLQTPAQKVAAVLQAPGSQIARVLQAYADKDQGGGDA